MAVRRLALVLLVLFAAAPSASASAREPNAELRRDCADAAFGREGEQAPRVTTPKEERIGLWDQYGGSMDSGWARWILELYQAFPRLTPAPARRFKLPIADHLVENGKPLPEAKFFAPGSVLTARIDSANPVAHGMKERTDIFFDNSPVFRLDATAAAQGIRPVAWFDTAAPLKSGWAWGQSYLQNGVAVIDAPLGKGRVLLFGPEIIKRAQPHGTFKSLFNGIYYSAAAPLSAATAR
jgi:hypothetical protein